MATTQISDVSRSRECLDVADTVPCFLVGFSAAHYLV